MFAGNELSHVYKTLNGVRVFDDYGAVLGWKPEAGNTFKIAVDGWSYGDITVSEDNFSGRILSYNEGIWGYTAGCATAQTSEGDTQGIEYNIPEGSANANLRCAIYLTNEGSGDQTRTQFGIRTYNTQSHVWGSAFPFQYTTLDSTINMFVISIPYNTSPGYVQQLSSTPENILGRANTIRGNVSAEYVGVYYNLTHIASNVPIFDSLEHANDYLADETDETYTGILNLIIPDPEADYKKEFDFWFVKNKFGKNTRNVLSDNIQGGNYRFYPKRDGIAYVKRQPTPDNPYAYKLYHHNSYTCKTSDDYDAQSDDEYYEIGAGQVRREYIPASISFASYGSDDYYTTFDFQTNIPYFYSEEEAEDYFNGLIPITAAANYDQIARIDNSIIDPDFTGTDKDTETSLGTNGMQFSYGCRLYAISNIELSALFTELFDPLNLEDILNGQKIFGSDGITQSIAGILYLPLTDLSEICELGSLANIKIGSWESQNAQGYRIINNDKIIDVGSFTFTPTYKDFRDFEPYSLCFLETGFWGFHQLQISKYYNKEVSCKVAIDCTTGATSLMLFGDGLLLDCFQGTCGASRPFVATDNNAYMNNVISSITQSSGSVSGGAGNLAGAIGDAGKLANAGGAVGAAGVAGVGVQAAGVAASGIFAGYNIKNAVDSPPQLSRGNLTGNLGYYSSDKIRFIIAHKKTIVPENRINVIGGVSGHGGAVGSFSGFLSCSAFKLADGFTGTDEERAEIMEIMRGGIYL